MAYCHQALVLMLEAHIAVARMKQLGISLNSFVAGTDGDGN